MKAKKMKDLSECLIMYNSIVKYSYKKNLFTIDLILTPPQNRGMCSGTKTMEAIGSLSKETNSIIQLQPCNTIYSAQVNNKYFKHFIEILENGFIVSMFASPKRKNAYKYLIKGFKELENVLMTGSYSGDIYATMIYEDFLPKNNKQIKQTKKMETKIKKKMEKEMVQEERKRSEHQRAINVSLMNLKLQLVQLYCLDYIQATDVVNNIKNKMIENDGIDACDWIVEMMDEQKFRELNLIK